MAGTTLSVPNRPSSPKLKRGSAQTLVIIELLFIVGFYVALRLIGTNLVQIQSVEIGRETVGDIIRITNQTQVFVDYPLMVLLALGLALPLTAPRLRREPVVLIAVQGVIVALLIFVLWPLAQVFEQSFKAGEKVSGYSFAQWTEILQQEGTRRAAWNTIRIGLTTAVIATVIGTLVSYSLTLTDVPLKRVLLTLTIMPLVSPPFAVSFAVRFLFGRSGVITQDLLNITRGNIYGSHGIVFVQLISDIPLVILIMSAVFASMSRDLEEAGEDLGGHPLYVLRRVTFPLVTPAILTAMLLTFISSIADFGNPMIIGGGTQVLATKAFIQFTEFDNRQAGAALALLLLFPALIAFALQHWISNRRSYITVTSGAQTGHIRKLPGYIKWTFFSLTAAMGALALLLYGSIFVGAFVKVWGFDWTPTLEHMKVLENALPQLKNSLIVSVAAGAVGGLLGMLLAWLVTRQKFAGRGALDFSATLMYAIPGTVVGIGYIIAFNALPYLWTGTFTIIIVAFAFRRLPVGLRTAVAAQKQIDPTLEEASMDLGASRLRTFYRISFPLLQRAFLAGVIFVFIRSMTDLSAAVFLQSARIQLYTNKMFSVMRRGSDSQAAAFAALLIVIVFIALAILGKVTGKRFVDLFRI